MQLITHEKFKSIKKDKKKKGWETWGKWVNDVHCVTACAKLWFMFKINVRLRGFSFKSPDLSMILPLLVPKVIIEF